MQAENVTRLDDNLVHFQHPHELVISHEIALPTEMSSEVDEHTTTLHALHRHPVDRERAHASWSDVVRSVAVVEEDLFSASADIDHLPDVSEAVPVGRVLQVEQNAVVVQDVGRIGIELAHRVVGSFDAVAKYGMYVGGKTTWVEHAAARKVEGKTEAEGDAFSGFREPGTHPVRRQECEPSELRAVEVAPGRAGRPTGL